MKKVFAILFAASLFLCVSCESTKQQAPEAEEQAEVVRASTERKKESASSAASSSKNQFKKVLQEMKISVVSSPKDTVAGKPFSSPYKIQAVTADGQPCAAIKIIAEYPASKKGESVAFENASLVTDQNGFAEFSAPLPAFAAKSNVLFYPEPPSSAPELVRMASAAAAEAPWRARTNLGNHTGILVSIVDYRQNGTINIGNGSQPSAQALTGSLWKVGLMGAQNADFHNSIDADDPARIRSDALKQLNGNSLFKFVVYGRVKYASEITKDDDGFYTATFSGDLGALNIATGEVLLKTSKTVTAKDKSEWKVLSNAQQEMAKLFCEELLYSLYQ